MVVGVSDARPRAWWPSPFGDDDQLGMLNHITDAKRAAALRLVRAGRLYDLGRVLDEDVPVFPGATSARRWSPPPTTQNARRRWARTGSTGSSSRSPATQQLGTHLDALSHLQIGDRGYNGWSVAELAGTAGVKRLGVETVPQIVTRGWLVDVAPARPPARSIGSAGHRPGARRRGAVPHRLGRPLGRPRHVPRRRAGPRHGRWPSWLVERGVALTGCDTWSYGPVPAEDPERPFEVPQILNARHGVFVVENLDTAELARDGVREFALVLTHPKLRGATGAWTSPIALV